MKFVLYSIRSFIHRLPPSVAIRMRDKLPKGITTYLSTLIRSPADDLAALLRGGYSSIALNALNEMADANDDEFSARAHWWLARWSHRQGKYAEALIHLHTIPAGSGADGLSKIILDIECQRLLGQHQEAEMLIENALVKYKKSSNFILICANHIQNTAPEYSESWFSCINQIYSDADLSELSPIDSSVNPSLYNIAGTPAIETVDIEQPLISVIMPVYRPSSEIRYAVQSLLRQTWKNLEIIIVDDASGEAFKSILEDIKGLDDRINVIHQKHNTGAYVARNLGLKYCKGQYITVHDADDWSHPQKIELQAKHLLSNPNVRANTTALARCKDDFIFALPRNPNAELVRTNYSSVMYRKDDLIKIGGWDGVRISADSELVRRFNIIHGKDCIKHIYLEVPLSFALVANSSLTGDPRTSLDTLYHGVRNEYLSAAMWWYKNVKQNSALMNSSSVRNFPVPEFISPVKKDMLLDIALIMDAQNPVDQYQLLNDLMLKYPKLRIGIFHWQVFLQGGTPKLHEIHENFREGAAAGFFRIICPGEIVRAEILIGSDVDVFKNPIDLPAKFHTSRFFIIKNKMVGSEEVPYAELVAKQRPRLVDMATLNNEIRAHIDNESKKFDT